MTNTNRYEVINTMPYFTHLFAGDILVPKHHALAGNCWGREDEEDVTKWVTFCPDYPHLFRLLKWWEHVPVDELPKYIKWVDGNDVEYFKVDAWYRVQSNDMFSEGGTLFVHDDYCTQFAYNYDGEIYPATEAEYNDYLNKLNSK